jgi:hypothetical protein
MLQENPFIVNGYVSDELFCDRDAETQTLMDLLTNGNHVALMSPRRIGKTGLIGHLFEQPEIKQKFYPILVDIYATKNLDEFVTVLGHAILRALLPWGKKTAMTFVNALHSLRTGIGFDINGNPTWNIEVGDIHTPKVTLDEIFEYISHADKPCLIAIDEFQVISDYPDKTIEALLRTHIQHCNNASFIYTGSERTMMANIFQSAARPFYQSTTMVNIGPLPQEKYIPFACRLFRERGKEIEATTVEQVYQRFEGVTWYMQRVMNELYARTPMGAICQPDMIEPAIRAILDANSYTYESLLFQLPAKQKALLMAIAKAGKAKNLTSSAFIKQYHLTSSSSIQSAIKGLVEKDFVTTHLGIYQVYDLFFRMWLLRE